MVKSALNSLSRGFFYSLGRLLFLLFIALVFLTIFKIVCHDSGSTLVDPDSLHTTIIRKRGAVE